VSHQRLVTIILLATFAAGCVGSGTVDRRDEYPLVCEIHGVPMETYVVPIKYGELVPDINDPPEYANANTWAAGGRMVEEATLAEVRSCPECRALRLAAN
jgi:hypothetical protein